MKQSDITVKNESFKSFIERHSVRSESRRDRFEDSDYYQMKDHIFLNKSTMSLDGFFLIDEINFEIEDMSHISRTKLVNKYKYKKVEYDDVSMKFELVDFKIELLQA